MSMSRVKNTQHAYDRSKERAGLTKREAQHLIKEAYLSGTAAKKLPDGPIKDFLVNKEIRTRKRIKMYKDWVFVFCKNSTKCITMYKIDDDILKRQEEYERIK